MEPFEKILMKYTEKVNHYKSNDINIKKIDINNIEIYLN